MQSSIGLFGSGIQSSTAAAASVAGPRLLDDDAMIDAFATARRLRDQAAASRTTTTTPTATTTDDTTNADAQQGSQVPTLSHVLSQTFSAVPNDRAVPTMVMDPPTGYCTICHEEFGLGQPCCILHCAHKFHTRCWQSYFVSQNGWCTCPNCRGPSHVTSHVIHMGPVEFGMVNPVANPDQEMGSVGPPASPAQGEMVPLLPTTSLESNDLDDVSRRPPTEYSTDNHDAFSVIWRP